MWANLQVNRLVRDQLPGSNERVIVLLTGARQTGKTTLLKKVYPDLPYYNLDSIEYREQLRSISSFQWGNEVGSALIDEIQKEPELMDKIKFSFDEGNLVFTAMSGSAQVLLLKKMKETLAGRIKVLELFPFTLGELVHMKEHTIPASLLSRIVNSGSPTEILVELPSVLLGEKWERKKKSENYLIQWGGMPSLIHIQDSKKKVAWLKDYSTTYLQRDLGDLARLNDLMPFRKFQQLAALRSANLLSYSELSRDSGISSETARRYLEYLKLSYQAEIVQPYHQNLTSRLVKTPKIFWLDNGLLRQLAGYGFELLNGQLYENYIASEIIKYFKSTRSEARLSFYRTRSGMEVDFCIETPKGLIGIEVKNRDTISKKDYTSLRSLKEAADKKWLCGLVLYRGNRISKLQEDIWAVPSCRLFS